MNSLFKKILLFIGIFFIFLFTTLIFITSFTSLLYNSGQFTLEYNIHFILSFILIELLLYILFSFILYLIFIRIYNEQIEYISNKILNLFKNKEIIEIKITDEDIEFMNENFKNRK